MTVDHSFWRGKSVFLTGHTGFKGGWLSLWLQAMGATVTGFALAPPTRPNLFEVADVGRGMKSVFGDIRDLSAVVSAMSACQPDIVIHMAAQPLVRHSYVEPVETYATNVMGTVHVLEAVRRVESVKAVVNVTTDKCYENREWLWGYREDEAMGGHDPYSNSKGCAELVTSSYRRSFFAEAGVALGSGRAGNVIGGGDWADDRIVPDFFRASMAQSDLQVRFPDSTRPWQHVLEPLSGYLMLAERLFRQGQAFSEGWNFGPTDEDARPVRWLLSNLTELMPGTRWQDTGGAPVHEAGFLKLDSSKARSRLGWVPRWDLRQALAKTVDWHVAWTGGQPMNAFCLRQIAEHQTDVAA